MVRKSGMNLNDDLLVRSVYSISVVGIMVTDH